MTLQLQRLIELIDTHATTDDFLTLYRHSVTTLKPFEQNELLLRACRFGTLAIIQALLNDGHVTVDNCRHPSTGCSPLFIAIRAHQTAIIHYLIHQIHVDINSSTNRDETCLHEAIRQRDLSTVKLLLEHGAIVDERHFLLAIKECAHKPTCPVKTGDCPVAIFDAVVVHQPILLDSHRETAAHCLLRCTKWLHNTLLFSTGDLDPPPQSSVQNSCIPLLHRTQVAIVGAGPAGLVLGALLTRAGIDSVILERQSRLHVESVIRAGMLEQSMVDLLDELGVADRLLREGIVQRNLILQFNGRRYHLPVAEMTQGKVLTIYGQNNILKDLITARVTSGKRLWFDIEHVHIERHGDNDDESDCLPLLRFRRLGSQASLDELLECDFIAGCDGAISECCRKSIPSGALRTVKQTYPMSWLSILAAVPPSSTEIIFAHHPEHGFALHTLRSLTHTRLHLQVPSDDTLAQWPNERIWAELRRRLTPDDNPDGWTLAEGPIVERMLFPLRSIITEPIQYKRLFLLGDAAHITLPTGAKGMNLAVSDAQTLAQAFIDFYEYDNDKRWDKLKKYSSTCLTRIREAQEFSIFMTMLTHLFPDATLLDKKLQHTLQEEVQQSTALQRYVIDMYVH